MKLNHFVGLYLTGILISNINAESAVITGAGATFPYPIYAKWAEVYRAKTGVSLNYQPIGSGGGIKQITAGTVDFGASDMPLKSDELKKNGLIQWPMIIGGVVPVVNISGINVNELKLSGTVLAQIFLGVIKKWNDSSIVKINPGLKLPDQSIAVVHRSDGSGTTFLFTSYLSSVDSEWASKVGYNSSVQWPVGIGGKGNEGVANYVKQGPGAIGYVEYAYAIQTQLVSTKMKNKDGVFVSPGIGTFQAAASNANWENTPDFYIILTNQPGENSWPITGASFILMHAVQPNSGKVKTVLDFFTWAFSYGGTMAKELDYVPIPSNVVPLIKRMWADKILKEQTKPDSSRHENK